MTQKKNDKLGQNNPIPKESKRNYENESLVQCITSNRTNSKNTTIEKIGQTTLIFTNKSESQVEDDSLESSIRYLKFQRMIKKLQ